MTNWNYASGRLEARDETDTLFFTVPVQPMWAVLADCFNADPCLARSLLVGLGFDGAPFRPASAGEMVAIHG